MNYSTLRPMVTRDLKRCIKLGLQEWVKDYVEELVERAARRWHTSRDNSQTHHFRRHSYERAVRTQAEALDLLSAYMQSQARARDASKLAPRQGNDGK